MSQGWGVLRKRGNKCGSTGNISPQISCDLLWDSEVVNFSPHDFPTLVWQRKADGIYHPLMATHQLPHF